MKGGIFHAGRGGKQDRRPGIQYHPNDRSCIEGCNRPNYVTTAFPKLLEEHGLRKIRFHDLRHSCAGLLLANNVQKRKDSYKPLKHWCALGYSCLFLNLAETVGFEPTCPCGQLDFESFVLCTPQWKLGEDDSL